MKAFRSCASLFVLFWLLAPAHVLAADQSPPIEHKPFATRHVVLQISDDSPRKQAAVLNVASNLIKYYGPDKLDVEVVAFGHGLPLLLAGNANAERIHSLALSGGVKFDACENTLQTMARKLGHVPKLVPDAKPVPSGAARIVELVHDGYILIRP